MAVSCFSVTHILPNQDHIDPNISSLIPSYSALLSSEHSIHDMNHHLYFYLTIHVQGLSSFLTLQANPHNETRIFPFHEIDPNPPLLAEKVSSALDISGGMLMWYVPPNNLPFVRISFYIFNIFNYKCIYIDFMSNPDWMKIPCQYCYMIYPMHLRPSPG